MGKFNIGQLVATAGVVEMAENDPWFSDFIGESLGKYVNCDWGDTCPEDSKLNDSALIHDNRILAVYKYNDEVSIWIITEWDRSATTILFPEEY